MTPELQLALIAIGLLAALVVGVLAARPLLRRLLAPLSELRSRAMPRLVYRHVIGPARLLAGAAIAQMSLALTPVAEEIAGPVLHLLTLVLIGAVGWLAIALVGVAAEVLADRLDVSVHDNLRARRGRTQVMIARRVGAVTIGVITLAVMLMTFSSVRALGASLLASAGILGIVVGIAAQQPLANLIAGIQIALTEPIRLDDVVVVEGEWGRIEEISFTYVVVKTWDERRVVLPISYFTQTPFQNWTHRRSELVGSVTLHTDYRVPIDDLREELDRIVRESELWDGRVVVLQAIEAHEHTLELRALVSAVNAPTAWDLRCLVRERLLAYLTEHHPESLPRVRTEPEREQASVASSVGG